MSRKIRRPAEIPILLALAAGALYVLIHMAFARIPFAISPHNYLILHNLLELASILVSFSVFVVNWEASKQNRSARSLFIATGFLTVASVDTMHTLSYAGMPDFFTPNETSKAAYYWLFARLWAAGLLWAAAHIRPETSGWGAGRIPLLGLNLGASVAWLAFITLRESSLPPLFVEGEGVTALKAGLELGVMGVSLAATVAHIRVYRSSRDEAVLLLVAALVVGTIADAPMTVYSTPYEPLILVGHLYKVVAYYLIFRALVVSSVHRPYIQLRVAKERLEETVATLDVRNRELDALDEVAVTLSSSLKPDAVLESAIEKVMKVMQAGAGAIFLLENGTENLKLAAWHGLNGGVVAECLAHPSRLPFGLSSSLHHAKLATALEDRALVRSLGDSLARIAPLRACICAPVVSKGRLLGSIAMVSDGERAFLPRDVDLLTAIGYQLGLAIDNARLYERTDERLQQKLTELERSERRSRFLSEASALLGSSMEPRIVLDTLARKTTDVVGDWVLVYLLDPTDLLLRLEAVYHSDEEEMADIRRTFDGRTVSVGESLIGQVAGSGQPILIARLSPEQMSEHILSRARSLEDVATLRRVMPTSMLVAPMRARGRTVGVMLVAVTHAGPPLGDAELQLVVGLADRAGAAIDNSRLFHESQSQRQHLEAIISQMVDGVVIADPEGRITVANPSARTMLGERMGQLSGEEIDPAGDAAREQPGGPSAHSLVGRALSGELVVGEEVIVQRTMGERYLNASASPVRDDSGEISGAVLVLRDVTAEREVEKMKEEFVAVVSHELRTPITAVLGYTDILLKGLRGPLAPRQMEALSSVRTAANRLLLLINDILDLSRLEAGAQELSLAPVDLRVLVKHAVSSMGVLAMAKGIQMVKQLPSDLPMVLADSEQLYRILGNLMSNAIKFTPEGGTVIISAFRTDGDSEDRLPAGIADDGDAWVAVTVSDTGIGITPEQQDRIWGKFQQADSSSRRPFGGTGLGLAITRGLVELHRGRVWVESEGVSGKGSTFGFTLPTVPQRQEGPESPQDLSAQERLFR